MLVLDDDISEPDTILLCTADPLTADNARSQFLACDTSGNRVSFSVIAR